MGPRIKIIAGFVFVVLVCAVAAAYLTHYAYSNGPPTGKSRVVEIPSGLGPRGLSKRLEKSGLIHTPVAFVLWMRLFGSFENIKAGRFEIDEGTSPVRILEILSGRSSGRGVQVVIPEGFTITRIAGALRGAGIASADGFVDGATDPKLLAELEIPGPTAEGFLFPDTYYFDRSATPRSIIEKMHGQFKTKYATIRGEGKDSVREIVILASIVQAEATVLDEMPLIAGVYKNRLNNSQFPARILQADPTVAYGCEPHVRPRAPSCARFEKTLYRTQLDDPQNPYNTYQHKGLPPGPICAPGLAALKAAAHPADVPYLYFVAQANGRHTFSATLKQHQNAVKRYRLLKSSTK